MVNPPEPPEPPESPEMPPPGTLLITSSQTTTSHQQTNPADHSLRAFLGGGLTILVLTLAVFVLHRAWWYDQPQDTVQTIATGTRLNVNRMNADMLTLLPGIGPTTAQRLIEFREERHRQTGQPLQNLDQLILLPGVGKLTVTRLEPWLICEP